MDTKTMTQLLVGFLIGAVILASMVPIFINVQNISGDEVTLTNDSQIVLREIQDGDVLTCVVTDGGRTWTLNDVVIENATPTSGQNTGIISDGVYVSFAAGNNQSVAVYYDMTKTTPSSTYLTATNGVTYSFTASEGNITYASSATETTVSFAYTWGYVICPLADGEYYSSETGGIGICKTADDLILCGAYTTGDFDAMYYYINGETYISNTAYTMAVNDNISLHDNTTDIYDISVSVDVTDGTDTETFTPYRIFLPYEVSGHASGGALYSIFGILPLIAGVGLLMGAVYYFISRH